MKIQVLFTILMTFELLPQLQSLPDINPGCVQNVDCTDATQQMLNAASTAIISKFGSQNPWLHGTFMKVYPSSSFNMVQIGSPPVCSKFNDLGNPPSRRDSVVIVLNEIIIFMEFKLANVHNWIFEGSELQSTASSCPALTATPLASQMPQKSCRNMYLYRNLDLPEFINFSVSVNLSLEMAFTATENSGLTVDLAEPITPDIYSRCDGDPGFTALCNCILDVSPFPSSVLSQMNYACMFQTVLNDNPVNQFACNKYRQ